MGVQGMSPYSPFILNDRLCIRGRLEKKVNTLNKAEMRSKFVFEEGGAVRAEKRRKGGIRGMDT
jgi:hypothetical protein